MIGVDRLTALADEHGTPFYAYDLDELGDRASTLRAALPERVELAFAVKANPSLAVLARLAESGLGADVASGGELAATRIAGFEPSAVVFTGPGKRDEELALAASMPIRSVTVESLGELERLEGIAAAAGTRVRVLLRAAGDDQPGNVIGSGGGRFGMRPDDLVAAARRATAARSVDLVGLHRFDASNVLDADVLVAGARRTVAQAVWLAREVGVRLRTIDLGGGLGIPYHGGQPPLDLVRLADGLRDVLDGLDAEPGLAGAGLLLEPGRWLAGPIGAYVTTVVDVKEAGPGRVVTVDGGIHHLLRPALAGRPHRIRSLAPDRDGRTVRRVLVGGPLCTALDVLGRVDLPDPAVGDRLAVLDAGAYGFTESMPYFLSHPIPPEVMLREGRTFLGRPRLDPAALLAAQSAAADPALTPDGIAT